jgi:hypothetical protein
MKENTFPRRILIYLNISFGIAFVLIWLDEILDIPHYFFGTPEKQANLIEATTETIVVLIACILVNYFTLLLMKRIKHLEGFHAICAKCNKIRDGEDWVPVDRYIKEHSEARLSHSYCPDCAKDFLKDFEEEKRQKGSSQSPGLTS